MDNKEKNLDIFRSGVDTSEYATAKAGGWVAKVVMVIGLLTTFVPQIIGNLPEGSTASIWGGIVLVVVAAIGDVLIRLGYMKGRENVKRAEAEVRMTENISAPENE